MPNSVGIEASQSPEANTDPSKQFDDIVRAVREGLADGGLPEGVFIADLLDESALRERITIAPDGVSLFKTGDNTLKSREVLTVNLAALNKTNGADTDAPLGDLLDSAAGALGLTSALVEQLQVLDAARARDEQHKVDFHAHQEETGYSRGDWTDWGYPYLKIVKTTKKDGTVSMGALLGATTTTTVSLGGDRVDGPARSGLNDTDDLWKDGMQENRNVKIPLPNALSWVERLTLESAQEVSA